MLTVREKLDAIQALHRSKRGRDKHGEYEICDYDKTSWPCKTQRILANLPSEQGEVANCESWRYIDLGNDIAKCNQLAGHKGKHSAYRVPPWSGEGTRSKD